MKTNFLFITADDLNYDSVGAYGCKVDDVTPHIDRLAAEGIRFEHAHVTIAVCQPSRSVLMTGRYPERNGARGFGPISRDVSTLQEQLSEAGYYNGIIGKEDHIAPKEKFCWDEYIRTMDEENGLGRSPKAYYEHVRGFLEHAKKRGKPFFLMANSHDPHRPFAGSEQELNMFGHPTEASRTYSPEEVEVPGFLPNIADVRKEVAQYFTSVHRLDETVGEILRALQESGLEEETMVMFLSDNGMAFPYAKTNCYLNSTKTPWIVKWPGRIDPGTVDDCHMISGIDFMPTIMEAAGLKGIDGLDGSSFLPVLKGEEQSGRDAVFTVFHETSGKNDFEMRCYQNREFGYIYNGWSDGETVFKNESQSGLTFQAMVEAAKEDEQIEQRVKFFQYRAREELYDFRKDRHALMNLAEVSDYESVIMKLKQGMLTKMEEVGDRWTDSFSVEMKL
ncbi:sulfatase [Paenibacillus sp. HB172176]|uniref:sulfatase family protein n=1 Tax=Paenibacillus sp. HB172176 TaxID=2493690 RepID=UPI001438B3DE|nr:sulfatase [Paenibacillus sp. HB172176]